MELYFYHFGYANTNNVKARAMTSQHYIDTETRKLLIIMRAVYLSNTKVSACNVKSEIMIVGVLCPSNSSHHF